MKRIISLVMILVMLFTLAACGASDATPGETTKDDQGGETSAPSSEPTDTSNEVIKIKIGWSPPDITGVFKTATDYMEMAIEEAKTNGIEIELITRAATSHTSAADQVKTIENFIQNKVDVIIISPAEVEAVKPVLKEVNEAGIPIIMVNMLDELEGIDITSFIGFDNQQAAAVTAYSLLDALGGPGVLGEGEKADVDMDTMLDLAWWEELYKNVDTSSISGKIAVIEGIAGDYFSNERLKGFHSVVDKFPGIEVKATLPADWNRQKGIDAAENILQNNKELDAIYAASNEMGMGASIAVKTAGRESEIFVVTQDGTPESVDYIREGGLKAETWHGFPEWGWYGVKFAVMIALDQEVPYKFDVRPRTEYTDNADNFYPTPKLETIAWADIIADAK
jgi:ribose transport system substrate-binding protein